MSNEFILIGEMILIWLVTTGGYWWELLPNLQLRRVYGCHGEPIGKVDHAVVDRGVWQPRQVERFFHRCISIHNQPPDPCTG